MGKRLAMAGLVALAMMGSAARGAILFSTMDPVTGADLSFTPNVFGSVAPFYEDSTLTSMAGGVQGKGYGGIGYIVKPGAGVLRQISAPFNVAFPEGFRMEVYKVQTPLTQDASGNFTSTLTFQDSATTTDLVAGPQWVNWDFTTDGSTISFDGTSSYLFLPSLVNVHGNGAYQLAYWLGRALGGTSGTYVKETNVAPVNTALAEASPALLKGPLISSTPWIYVADQVTFAPEPGTAGMMVIGVVGLVRLRKGR